MGGINFVDNIVGDESIDMILRYEMRDIVIYKSTHITITKCIDLMDKFTIPC